MSARVLEHESTAMVSGVLPAVAPLDLHTSIHSLEGFGARSTKSTESAADVDTGKVR